MKQIKLTQGKVALVDDDDYNFLILFNWSAHYKGNTFYAKTNIPRRGGGYTCLEMHQLILAKSLEFDTNGLVSDHIDRDGLNNQKHNLRRVSKSLNIHNSRVRGVSKYKGVCWQKSAWKWKAQIRVRGKLRYLGLFCDESEAASAYDAAAREVYGDNAILNFKTEKKGE